MLVFVFIWAVSFSALLEFGFWNRGGIIGLVFLVLEFVMNKVEFANEFEQWFEKLRNRRAKQGIMKWIRRYMEDGVLSGVKPVGGGIFEFSLDTGPGYRVYYIFFRQTLIVLWGGDKGSQSWDIKKAKNLASKL